jgi:phosphatidate cytidylyltransferase
MSFLDPSEDRDVRRGRPAGSDYGYEYGDGVSPHPMYGQGTPPVPLRSPAAPDMPSHPTGPLDPTGPLEPVGPLELAAPAGQPGPADPPNGGGPSRRRPGADVDPLELDLSEHGRTARPREDRRAEVADAKRHRAGRNLPAAIGVGVLLAGIVLGSLFVWKPAFVAVLAVAAGVGVWEMVHAVGDGQDSPPPPGGKRRRRSLAVRARPSVVPLLGGCVLMPALAWFGGVEDLILGLLITVIAVLVWRLSTGPEGFHRDMPAAVLIAVYVPFLIGFGVLLAHPSDGKMRVLVTLACVILSDTGGYAAGVFLGKHPMAPRVSPKKSWEGFGGSLVATAVGGSLLVHYLLDQPFWHGAVIGLGVSLAAVLGDLTESLIKRDLGVKDMSSLLPGHGGLMDRLDSVVFAAPAAFMLMSVLA